MSGPRPACRGAFELADGATIHLRRVADHDSPVLQGLFDRVVSVSGGYPHISPVPADEFTAYWLEGKTVVVIAELDGAIVGSYFLKPNHPGRAAHIANCGYMVSPDHQGRGIGRALVVDSIDCARGHGFDAMQFNLVFASNVARPMYEDLGFEVVGRVPEAVDGEDAVIYWRRL